MSKRAQSLPLLRAAKQIRLDPTRAQTDRTDRLTNLRLERISLADGLLKDVISHGISDLDHILVAHSFLFKRLTGEGTSSSEFEILRTLQQGSIAITSEDVEKVFLMTTSVPSVSQRGPYSLDLFYCRTWKLAAQQLQDILVLWDTNHQRYEETRVWNDLVRPLLLSKSDVYIRYIGTVDATNGRSAADRLAEDLLRTDGLMASFLKAYHDLFATEAPVTVQYFQDATLSLPVPSAIGDPVRSELRDERERLLISQFNRTVLLNRQPGGYFPSFTLSERLTTLAHSTNTSVLSRFHAVERNAVCQAAVETELTVLMDEVRSFVNAEAALSGCSGPCTLTHDYVHRCLRPQLTPTMLGRGWSLLVLIGKDLTREDLLSSSTFLHGKSRAGHLTKSILSKLERIEQSVIDTRISTDPEIDQRLYAFIDLYPCLRVTDELLSDFLRFLRRYLSATKPVIVVAFSQQVASVATANFLHDQGLSWQSTFLDVVGVPRLSYHDAGFLDNGNEQPDQDTACIVMPHIHPGRDKYDHQPKVFREVLFLMWLLTFKLCDLFLTLEPVSGFSNKPALLTELLRAFSVECAEEVALLNRAKSKLLQEWKRFNIPSRAGGHSTVVSERNRRAAEARWAAYGYAEGRPRSADRRQQVDCLWKMNYPALHIRHGRDDAGKRSWMDWAMKLGTGKSFLASVVGNWQADSTLNAEGDSMFHLLKQYGPKDVDLRTLSSADRQDIMEKWQAKMLEGKRAKGMLEPGYVHSTEEHVQRLDNIQNRTVKITANRMATIRWLDVTDNSTLVLQIPAGRSIAAHSQARFVFVAEGLRLESLDDPPILCRIGRDTHATVTWTYSVLLQRNVKLFKCWLRQLELSGIAIPAAAQAMVQPASTSRWPESGRPEITANTRIQEYRTRYPAPLSAIDRIALVNDFLNAYNQGPCELCCARTDLARLQPISFRILFVEFLETHAQYDSHPHRAVMRDLCSNVTPHVTSQLQRMLEYCRGITRKELCQGTYAGKRQSGQILHLGGRQPGF